MDRPGASQPLRQQPTSDAAPNIASDQSVDAMTIAGPKATRRKMVEHELPGSLRRAILDERNTNNPIATSTKDSSTADIWPEIAFRNDPNTAGW
ncbi:hypothetical protein B0T21DRAFT_377917 [Apiosordaria backusii]|uniref:DUF3295 domain-containing protein n=1 Tax=Apiosordaria backusii TaxID=314023 RepID=A0AA40DI08_9PEZI|nr:hypothetical protein B0T21DRAFT_377917 [Apiosordaria backusii]